MDAMMPLHYTWALAIIGWLIGIAVYATYWASRKDWSEEERKDDRERQRFIRDQ